MPSDSIAAYDLPSRVASYDRDMELMHPNRSKMVDITLEIVSSEHSGPSHALELGCGTGYFTKRFLENFPSFEVLAIDGAQAMVDLAKVRLGKLAERVDFKLGDFRNLPKLIPGKTRVSVVFSSFALHHLNRAEKIDLIQQSIRFLEPGGWFINADIVKGESELIEKRIQEIRVQGILRKAAGKDERFQNAQSIRQFLRDLEARDRDQPQTLGEDLHICREAGLASASIFWAEYREVVYGGVKPGPPLEAESKREL
jgi:tRNA (cmo5U34)-methyltransferase